MKNQTWSRYCLGTRENGQPIEPNDPRWDLLKERAKESVSNPLAWLELRQIYGDLGKNVAFADAFGRWRKMIGSEGVVAALRAYCH